MDSNEIKAARAVIEAATFGDGLWIYTPPKRPGAEIGWVESEEGMPIARIDNDKIGTFLAAARLGWPKALDEIEAITKNYEEMRGAWHSCYEENASLRAALEWYADKNRYTYPSAGPPPIDKDKGLKARKALK